MQISQTSPSDLLLRTILAVAIVVVAASAAEAQRVVLDWDVTVRRGFHDAASQTVFGPTPEIELNVTVGVDEEADDFVQVEPGFFEAVRIELVTKDGGERVPISVRWRDEAICLTSRFERCSLAQRAPLMSGARVQATAVLAPADGSAVMEGPYRVELDFTSVRPFLRGVDNALWLGGLRERGTLDVRVRSVATTEDRRQYYRVQGGAALLARDRVLALELFRAWVADFPEDPQGHGSLGLALLEHARFEEAASAFERALSLRPGALTDLPSTLGAAYVGMGQEERAAALLEQHVAPARLPEAMERARQTVGRAMDAAAQR